VFFKGDGALVLELNFRPIVALLVQGRQPA
jgi:hypothetical protein